MEGTPSSQKKRKLDQVIDVDTIETTGSTGTSSLLTPRGSGPRSHQGSMRGDTGSLISIAMLGVVTQEGFERLSKSANTYDKFGEEKPIGYVKLRGVDVKVYGVEPLHDDMSPHGTDEEEGEFHSDSDAMSE